MKLLLLTLAAGLFFLTSAHADTNCTTSKRQEPVYDILTINTDAPAHLKGATITVTLANGKATTVPAERFKVVPRKQTHTGSKFREVEVVTCTELAKKNRVSLLGGVGPSDRLERSSSAGRVDVKSTSQFNAGIQYQRSLSNDISVGGQVQSNKAGALMLGVDF